MTYTSHPIEAAVTGGTVHGIRLEPQSAGARQQTPILFLHGGPGGTFHTALPTISALAEKRPLICYDQLGGGESTCDVAPEHLKIERYISEISSVMDAQGLKKVHLFGHSCGGSLAAPFAAEHPDRVERLILSSPLLCTKRWLIDANELFRAAGQDEDTFYERHVWGMPAATRPQYYKDAMKICSDHVYETMWGKAEFTCDGVYKDYSVWDRLHKIKAPTLITCGEFDECRPQRMREAASLMPNARVNVIPDCAHLPYIKNPSAYVDAIDGFLSVNAPNAEHRLNTTSLAVGH